MDNSIHLITKRFATPTKFRLRSTGGDHMRATHTMRNLIGNRYFVNHRQANLFTRAILFLKNRGNKSRPSIETVHLAQIARDSWSMRDIGHTIRNL
jgi:hypothetical protein